MMQCENGYVKPGVRGILCRKCEEPKEGDLRSVAHALCGHQRFCPNARCYQFLPSWEKCTLREKGTDCHVDGAPRNDNREEGAGRETEPQAGKPNSKKKAAKKSAESAERKGE